MQHENRIKNIVKILGIMLVLLVFLGLTFYFSNINKKNSGNTSTPSTPGVSGPTQNEKQMANDQKQTNINRADLDQSPQAQIKSALPLITYINEGKDTYEIGSIINGIYEDGGVCKLIAKKNTLYLTFQDYSIKNPRSLECKTFSIPKAKLPEKGQWSITVEYSSKNAQGTSESRNINNN